MCSSALSIVLLVGPIGGVGVSVDHLRRPVAARPSYILVAETGGPAPTTAAAGSAPARERVVALRLATLLGALLVIIFLASALAVRRFSRRFKAYLLRENKQPTPSEDVWQMHRLPDNDGADEEP